MFFESNRDILSFHETSVLEISLKKKHTDTGQNEHNAGKERRRKMFIKNA